MRIIASLLMLTFLTGCDVSKKEQETPIKVGSNLWPGYEMIYLADHLGYYEPNVVEINQLNSASDVMAAFAKGELNAAALTLDETIQLWDQGLPIEIIMITDISDGGDMVLAKPEIRTFFDLKGKTIGLEDSALGAYMLERFLQFSSLKEQDIIKKTFTVNQHSEAYSNNEVDAIITFDPEASKIKAMGAHQMFSSKDIPNEIIDVIVISTGENKPSEHSIHHFLEGYYQARQQFKLQIDQPASGQHLSFISKRLDLSEEETLMAYQQLKLPSKDESLSLMGIGGVMINSMNYMGFILEKADIIKQGCDCRNLINLNHLTRKHVHPD